MKKRYAWSVIQNEIAELKVVSLPSTGIWEMGLWYEEPRQLVIAMQVSGFPLKDEKE